MALKRIERIKDELEKISPIYDQDGLIALPPGEVRALVEYFEASEAHLHEQIIEIDEDGKVHDPMARLQKARAELEREDD